jgi:regulator of protease activity HflC (stomatin/prohibitin superfamily)
MLTGITVVALVALFLFWKTFKVVEMREAVVKERLGRFAGVLRPGLHFLIPFVDRVAYQQEMREQVIDIPPQSCVTSDNIQVDVDGVVFLKVMDPEKASYGIGDYLNASVNLAQTTMRSEIGKLELDRTFQERETVNENIVREIDKASDPWGIKMMRYEIRNIAPSRHVVDTLEKQMEAERHKRARITLAEAEKEARINSSAGERQEAVNLSEGERERRINEANGRAKAILLVSEATAWSVERVAAAIRRPGGEAAVKMRIVESFLHQLGQVLQTSTVSVVPAELAQLKGFFEGMGKITTGVTEPRPNLQQPRNLPRTLEK